MKWVNLAMIIYNGIMAAYFAWTGGGFLEPIPVFFTLYTCVFLGITVFQFVKG